MRALPFFANLPLNQFAPFGVVLLAWVFLFLPVYQDLAASAWTRDENAHAPLLLAFCLGAIGVRLKTLNATGQLLFFVPSWTDKTGGFVLIIVSALAVFVGRVEQIEILISAAQLPFAAGCLLVLGGRGLLRQMWVPVAMLGYLIVWPGWMLDAVTAPLKMWISASVASVLEAAGLPVAFAGVNLAIGQYELLVEDACAGMNSLIALTATGAIYLYIVQHVSRWKNILIFAITIPLAIFVNLLRVIVLVLLTYYGGYDIGQGFLHEFAGLFMFTLALGGLFLTDALLDMATSTKRAFPLREVRA